MFCGPSDGVYVTEQVAEFPVPDRLHEGVGEKSPVVLLVDQLTVPPGLRVPGAASDTVTVHVVDSTGYTAKDFTGVTDSKGEFSPSWTISSNSKPGSFQVDIDASKYGYTPAHRTFSFDVV